MCIVYCAPVPAQNTCVSNFFYSMQPCDFQCTSYARHAWRNVTDFIIKCRLSWVSDINMSRSCHIQYVLIHVWVGENLIEVRHSCIVLKTLGLGNHGLLKNWTVLYAYCWGLLIKIPVSGVAEFMNDPLPYVLLWMFVSHAQQSCAGWIFVFMFFLSTRFAVAVYCSASLCIKFRLFF